MYNVYYANPLSGPGAGAIAWFDMGDVSLLQGQSMNRVYDLGYGYTVSFTVENDSVLGELTIVTGDNVPSYSQAPLGNINYTMIPAKVGLRMRPVEDLFMPKAGIKISNIQVLDPSNNPISGYQMVVADAETTGVNETLRFGTNGGPFNLLINIPPVIPPATGPTILGVGTTNVTEVGGATAGIGVTAPVFTTEAPTEIEIESSGNTSSEGIALGIVFSTLTLRKIINHRLSPLDQFELQITGPNSDTAITTGNSTGLQSEVATVWIVPGMQYTINEAMAPLSISSLGDYIISVAAQNFNVSGTVPPVGNLPINITPQFGDRIVYTITNSAELDFGDAPDTTAGNGPNNYTTLLQNNGPRHGVTEKLVLGTKITSELNAYQNPTATGDDIGLGIQDDGLVVPVKPILIADSVYKLRVSYINNIGVSANLYGWVDFDRNGIFEGGESAFAVAGITPLNTPNTVELVFTVPIGLTLVEGTNTFIRLRLTTNNLQNANSNPNLEDTRSVGQASNGEVEDYIVEIIDGTVEGNVWNDINCNGIRDMYEPGVDCVRVCLFNKYYPNVTVDITTTDANGYYKFENIKTGKYFVKFDRKKDSEFTTPNVGIDESIDSDVDKETGKSSIFLIDGNNNEVTIDAGICYYYKITGKAFYDCNGNGILDAGEPFLCGVVVILYDSLGRECDRTITDCTGCYEFCYLVSGAYEVKFISPPNMFITVQNLINYYGSKPNVNGTAYATINGNNIVNGFAGFRGNTALTNKYCNS